MEEELGIFFENFQKATSIRTILAEMGHQQQPTPVATDSKVANSIVNGTSKKNILNNRHEILLGQGQNTGKSFPNILGRGKEKPGGLCHKPPPNMAP